MVLVMFFFFSWVIYTCHSFYEIKTHIYVHTYISFACMIFYNKKENCGPDPGPH